MSPPEKIPDVDESALTLCSVGGAIASPFAFRGGAFRLGACCVSLFVGDAGTGIGGATEDDTAGTLGDDPVESDFDAVVPGLAPCAFAVGDASTAAYDRGSDASGIMGGRGNGTAITATGTLLSRASLTLGTFVEVDLPVSFGETVAGTAGTEAACSFAGVVESCAAHTAAKLPEFRVAEGMPPSAPKVVAGAALAVIASWSTEFTVKSPRRS